MSAGSGRADASHRQLASYYGRHAALIDGIVYDWDGAGAPRALREGFVQVAVSRDAWYGLGDKAVRWGAIFSGATAIATGSKHSLAIRGDGGLWGWGKGFAIAPSRLMDRVAAVVAAGDSATIALDADGALWQWDAGRDPRRLALPR